MREGHFQRVCVICGKTYMAGHPASQTCSDNCRLERNHLKKMKKSRSIHIQIDFRADESWDEFAERLLSQAKADWPK